jgi:hypothetical protein
VQAEQSIDNIVKYINNLSALVTASIAAINADFPSALTFDSV